GKEIALSQLRQGLLAVEKDTVTVNNVLKFWDESFDIINRTDKNSGRTEFLITTAFKEWLINFKDNPKSLALMGFDFSEFHKDTSIDKFLKKKMLIYLHPWYKYILAYNPHQILENIKIPILAVNGDQDENVNADANLSRFKSLAEELDLALEVVKVPNVNHLLQNNRGSSIVNVYENEETVSPD